jgi:hypothetical protein
VACVPPDNDANKRISFTSNKRFINFSLRTTNFYEKENPTSTRIDRHENLKILTAVFWVMTPYRLTEILPGSISYESLLLPLE